MPLGIPHSFFLGGPNRWTDLDQDKALAYMQAKEQVCPNCGTRDEDWLDESGRPLSPPPYEPVAHRCYGCADRERFQESIPSDQKGVYVLFKPYETVPEDPI